MEYNEVQQLNNRLKEAQAHLYHYKVASTRLHRRAAWIMLVMWVTIVLLSVFSIRQYIWYSNRERIQQIQLNQEMLKAAEFGEWYKTHNGQ